MFRLSVDKCRRFSGCKNQKPQTAVVKSQPEGPKTYSDWRQASQPCMHLGNVLLRARKLQGGKSILVLVACRCLVLLTFGLCNQASDFRALPCFAFGVLRSSGSGCVLEALQLLGPQHSKPFTRHDFLLWAHPWQHCGTVNRSCMERVTLRQLPKITRDQVRSHIVWCFLRNRKIEQT